MFNLPGNGVTRPFGDERGDLAQLSNIVGSLLKRISPNGPVLLLGHSFGATIATELASRCDDIDGLVLLSPIALPPCKRGGAGGVLARLAVRLSVWLLQRAPRAVSTAAIRSSVIATITNALYAVHGLSGMRKIQEYSAVERALAAEPRSMGEQLKVASEFACSEFAADVRCIVAIIAGDRDQMTSLVELQDLADRFYRSTLLLLPGAGHLAHHEDREAFSHLVLGGIDCVAGQLSGHDNCGS